MRDGNDILFFSFFRKGKDIMDSPTLGACPNKTDNCLAFLLINAVVVAT
jgi:hypothetical protein